MYLQPNLRTFEVAAYRIDEFPLRTAGSEAGFGDHVSSCLMGFGRVPARAFWAPESCRAQRTTELIKTKIHVIYAITDTEWTFEIIIFEFLRGLWMFYWRRAHLRRSWEDVWR